MKRIVYLLLFFIFAALSCEEDSLNGDIYKLEGQWSVNENTHLRKSTEDAYIVIITVNPSDSTELLIENFYGLGNQYVATAKFSFNKLTLHNQYLDTDVQIISGTGTISSNSREIDWSYVIDPGDSQTDNVTAIYTKTF